MSRIFKTGVTPMSSTRRAVVLDVTVAASLADYYVDRAANRHELEAEIA